MINSGLSLHLTRQLYESELRSQLQYRLSAYQLEEHECKELMKIISPGVLLNAFYVNKNYSRTLMRANDQYAGMGITHIYDVMVTEKSRFLMMHLRRNDTTGRLFRIAMEKLQLECGSGELFYNLDYDKWEQLVTKP